eukprot:GDKJ01049832.1.p1 GENE.GDKJ01049832.1~~GDKJ01049832.1.p1  ORF type:complete len:255 (-),score=6.29 GDKJ01049832.1:81-824(-)
MTTGLPGLFVARYQKSFEPCTGQLLYTNMKALQAGCYGDKFYHYASSSNSYTVLESSVTNCENVIASTALSSLTNTTVGLLNVCDTSNAAYDSRMSALSIGNMYHLNPSEMVTQGLLNDDNFYLSKVFFESTCDQFSGGSMIETRLWNDCNSCITETSVSTASIADQTNPVIVSTFPSECSGFPDNVKTSSDSNHASLRKVWTGMVVPQTWVAMEALKSPYTRIVGTVRNQGAFDYTISGLQPLRKY